MLILYSHIIIELREKANSFRTETNAETQEPMVEIICSQYNLDLQFTRIFFSLQSKLAHIGESRMEMDYKLVENEGLFQEYLEMGKYTVC